MAFLTPIMLSGNTIIMTRNGQISPTAMQERKLKGFDPNR